MNKLEIQQRILELRRQIEHANYLYYDLHAPAIGDADYDRLEKELLRLENDNPEFILDDSPVRNVSGGLDDKFLKVEHHPPMQSLDKTHSKEELLAFDEFLKKSIPMTEVWNYVVEPKVDGLSISLRYENRHLVRAATRGNGMIGDDVTKNIMTIRSLPKSLPASAPPVLELRGEVYMSREGFAVLNAEQESLGLETFANPRNAAAGSLKQINPEVTSRRPLEVVVYNSGGVGCDAFSTHAEMIAAFREWGFSPAPWMEVCNSIDSVFDAIDVLASKRHDFRFEIDGAVIKINERKFYSQLGATAHGPRWARAYKYPPERAETVLHQISIQVGRTGILTPVAELVPVFLSGSTISRATLHNADEILLHDFREGDHVWLVKAGEVIPAVESVIFEKRTGKEQKFVMPERCPVCGTHVVRNAGEVAYRCPNFACKARLSERLEHFCSRGALDIKQVGETVVAALVRSGLVLDILDIFSIKKEQWERLDISNGETVPRYLVGEVTLKNVKKHNEFAERCIAGLQSRIMTPDLVVREYLDTFPGRKRYFKSREFTEKEILKEALEIQKTTADKIRDRLVEVKALPLERWLFALGIPGVGVTVAKDIAAEHERLCDLADSSVLKNVIVNDEKTGRNRQVLQIKFEAAKAILEFFSSDYGKKLLSLMAKLGINPQSVRPKREVKEVGPLVGAGCVLTGTLSRPREEYAKLIEAAGGIVQSAVTKKTRYLIAGENTGATKTEKAKKLGTEVIDEERLKELLNG